MLNVFEVTELYPDEWVMLDRRLEVVDHGPILEVLRSRHGEASRRHTFLFATAASGSGSSSGGREGL